MRYGYFDDDKREYVIERPDVPVSWTNYLGVKDMCSVISHNAGGYSFYKSSEHGRITRFRPNGVPLDRPGHYVYLRDDESGEYRTISWQPASKDLSRAIYETMPCGLWSRSVFLSKKPVMRHLSTSSSPLPTAAKVRWCPLCTTGRYKIYSRHSAGIRRPANRSLHPTCLGCFYRHAPMARRELSHHSQKPEWRL